MGREVLERIYRESLEERIIAYLPEQKQISFERALNVYYRNRLADKIYKGNYGVQYLDYIVLV